MNKLRAIIFIVLCITGSASYASRAKINFMKCNASDLPKNNTPAVVDEIIRRQNLYRNKIKIQLQYIPSILENTCSSTTKRSIEQLAKYEALRQLIACTFDHYSISIDLIIRPHDDNQKINVTSCDGSIVMVRAIFDKNM